MWAAAEQERSVYEEGMAAKDCDNAADWFAKERERDAAEEQV